MASSPKGALNPSLFAKRNRGRLRLGIFRNTAE